MNYNFSADILAIREILEMTQDQFANAIGVQQVTLSRSELGKTAPSDKLIESIYSYAFERNIKLGRLKEMLWLESLKQGHKLLFHGAKGEIDEPIRADKSRANNDFGQGFYTGETYDQAISFVSGFDKSSVYFIDFNDAGLKCKKYAVNREWMLTIAYYRGALEEYSDHPMIRKIVEKSRDCDYIIAPIADNRMFQIINSFIAGEITDEQCKHCLAATNLGNQYVFTGKKAISKLKLIERCYIPMNEKDYYKEIRGEETRLGENKVKLARRQYRGKGRYIDEILK